MGRAIALKLSKEGAKVAISDISKEDCQKVAEEIISLGGEAIALKIDVTNETEINSAIREVKDKFGRIDILINNAGIALQGDLDKIDVASIDKVLDINLRGQIMCAKAVLPQMKEQKYGKIVNVASVAGLIGFAGSSIYCATKGGIIAFTRALALEVAKDKINVNAIAPGLIDTDMTKPFLQDENAKKSFLSVIPLGEVGTPEYIANMAAFLADDQNKYITGQTFVVDGGWTAA